MAIVGGMEAGGSGAQLLLDDVEDAAVAHIQSALITISRRSQLPQAHQQLVRETGIDLDRALSVLLSRLADWAPIRPSALAERMGLDLSTISRQVARLEEDGHLTRQRDPDDGRAFLIDITEQGRGAVALIRAYHRRRLAELLADWSHEDTAQLAELLSRLADAMTTPGDPIR